MATGKFHKMHGLGNDFVIIDARVKDVDMTTARAAAISDRHTGIGCDQLIVLRASDTADVKMQIFNCDGGEVEACGNATRCVVSLLEKDITIETSAGILSGQMANDGAVVDMGKPVFDWQKIPLAYAMDTLNMPVGWDELDNPVAVNVGNPHVVFFVPDADSLDLRQIGPVIENDPLFPEKVNVNVASVIGDGLKLHVWERGAGLTQACGTGACATAVAAIRRGLVSSPVNVQLPGGTLQISSQDGGAIMMQGATAHIFTGQADWSKFG